MCYECHECLYNYYNWCYNYLSFCLRILTPASLDLERAREDECRGPDGGCGGFWDGIMGKDGSGAGEPIFGRPCLRMGPA